MTPPLPEDLWFPVAPGITEIPNRPAAVIAEPVAGNSIPTPEGFDAANPGDVWLSLPVDTPPVYEKTLTPTALIPVYQEAVKAVGVVRLRLLATRYAYNLSVADRQASLPLTLGMSAARVKLISCDSAAYTFSGSAAALAFTKRVQAVAGSLTTTGYSAGSVRSYGIGTNAGTFALSGQVAVLKRVLAPLSAEVASFVLTGQNATSSGATTMSAAVGAYSMSGQAANSIRSYRLVGDAGSYSHSGQTANLGLPDPHFSSVVLLLHMNGTNGSTSFVDSSGSTKTVTAYNGAAISTAQSKFNGSSGLFDGANTYLLVDDSSDWYLGTGAFTIEAFIRLTAQATTATIAAQRGTDTSNHAWSFTASTASGGQLQFRYTSSGSSVAVRAPAWVPALNTWYHVCACRTAGTLRLFVDGLSIDSSANTVNIFDSPRPLMIGAGNNSTSVISPQNYLNGHIAELRITKGVGRYTGNFTVPTQPFPNF